MSDGLLVMWFCFPKLNSTHATYNRIRLVRLHCAWPLDGPMWRGAWSRGSVEWTGSAGARQLAAEVTHLDDDEATAWMSYGWDTISVRYGYGASIVT